MQCHKYAHGSCSTSHSLTIRKANAAIVTALEECLALDRFQIAPDAKRPASLSTDYDKLIAAEQQKLRRVLAAYEAGIDTIEEYAAKKKKLTAGIEELKAEQVRAAAESYSITKDELRDRVTNVLAMIQRDDISEAAKNQALRSVLSHVVYEKAHGRLALYFVS